MREDRAFLGRGWAFPPSFASDGRGVRMVADEEDVRQAIHLLLSTTPGERVMHPTFGCGLHRMVFETLTESVRTGIRDEVERAILFFEPRVEVVRIEVRLVDPLEGRLDILLEYVVRETNTRTNMVYPFYFLEATDLRVGR